MEFSVDAVANKMIMVIAGLSVILAVIGALLFMLLAQSPDSLTFAAIMGVTAQHPETGDVAISISDAIPFAAGIGMAAAVNIAKMLLMKRAVKNAVEYDTPSSAQNYVRSQYFMRLVVMAGVLLVAGLLHANAVNEVGNPQYVNFMGAFFGVLIFPVASYSMRFFLRDALVDNPALYVKPEEKSAAQSAIDELEAIGRDKMEG